MKNLFLVTAVLMTLCLTFASCSKDDSTTPNKDTFGGTYKISLDGSVLKEGTTPLVGVILDANGNHVNTATMGDTEINISVNQFPRTTGGTVNFGTVGDPGVVFTYNNKVYTTASGTLTRDSGSEISFEGTCTEMMSPTVHTISGSVKSDAFKVVK